ETTVSRNLGLDFSLFKNRLNGSVDLYLNTSADLLLRAKIPQTSGWEYQFQNIGKTQNKGLEIQLNGTILKAGDFTWNGSFNMSFNRNKIVSLGMNPEGEPLGFIPKLTILFLLK